MNRYTIINPVVKSLLRSPLHWLMSSNTALLQYRGRRSGKTYRMPVSYHATEHEVHLFTDASNTWWRNLQDDAQVRIRLVGRDRVGRSNVIVESTPQKREALAAFLMATPRDAAHAGVSLDADGHPAASDIAEASERLVQIEIELADR